TQGIPQEKAKAIVKAIKDRKFKKAQASIQGEEIRVQAPSKDELQEVIAFLRSQDWGIELKFGNYRGRSSEPSRSGATRRPSTASAWSATWMGTARPSP